MTRSALTGVLILVALQAACAGKRIAVNYWSPGKGEPTKVVVFLHPTKDGGCVSATLPQVVWVNSGDPVRWDIVNTCAGTPEVALEFEKRVVAFEAPDTFKSDEVAQTDSGSDTRLRNAKRYQERAGSGKGSEGRTSPPFVSRVAGKAVGNAGDYVKYRIRVNGTFVEDPGIGFWPPAG